MHYGITTLANDFTEEMNRRWVVRLPNTLFFFLRANPDNEPLYPKVESWAIEIDDEGWPQREVGLDSSGAPLFRAPNARNTGFWPDMAATQFNKGDLLPLSESEFNELWASFDQDT